MLRDLKAICTNVYNQNAKTIYQKCKIKEITFKTINYSNQFVCRKYQIVSLTILVRY